MSIIKFITTQLTLRTLRKSLVLLSKADTLQYSVTCNQVAQTRNSLLQLTGLDVSAINAAIYEAQIEQIQILEKETKDLLLKKEGLDVTIKRRMVLIDDLDEQIEAAQEKLAELNKASEATNTETDKAENTETE